MTEADYNPAIAAAKAAQEKVENCLDEGRSFRLEAGAGAGKTYSLVEALKRLIADQGRSMMHKGQRVACITFTEVARGEIAKEIEQHPAVFVETIHAFSWSFMSQFQPALRALVSELENHKDRIESGGGVGEKLVTYDLGIFRVTETEVALSHDDIPLLMSKLLENAKFRRLLAQQFPVIFIDEYQDTDREFMAAIDAKFFRGEGGPLIGLFGDHWQTIYRSEYELAQYPVEAIEKGSNFRSVPAIVDVLNALRPELKQVVRNPEAVGSANFFHCNLYQGERTNTPHSKADLPSDTARGTRLRLMARLQKEGWNIDKTKVLMLTHNVLAAEQGYPSIVAAFKGRNDQFARKEDPALKFFAETVEPMCAAFQAANYGEMFEFYGMGAPIRAHADKLAWQRDMNELLRLRSEGTIGDVVRHLAATRRPPLPSRLEQREDALAALAGAPVPEDQTVLQRYAELRQAPYQEVIEVVKFVEGSTPFATQHSVKGAEFENVLVVLGGGWNHYNWPQLFELLETKAITDKNSKGFYRARNLFYVSVSRPMKRLAVLATQTLSPTALVTIERLFGKQNVEALALGQIQP